MFRDQGPRTQKDPADLPILGSVNLKSGRYFLNFALLAVFLNWPSDLVVSY